MSANLSHIKGTCQAMEADCSEPDYFTKATHLQQSLISWQNGFQTKTLELWHLQSNHHAPKTEQMTPV